MTTAPALTDELDVNDLAELAKGFKRRLDARNRSPLTTKSYVRTVGMFRDYLAERDLPTVLGPAPDRDETPTVVTREHVEGYLIHLAKDLGRTPKTCQVRYGDLVQFFKWAVDDIGGIDNPIAKVDPPYYDPTIVPVPVVSVEDQKALVKVCEVTRSTPTDDRFVQRRDEAIIRLFLDCGLRLHELVALTVKDVELDDDYVTVLGKGNRIRRVAFAASTAEALDRYIRRERVGHRLARRTDALWLGERGQALTDSGVTQMLRRRCDQAGIGRIHPHQLRHTAADREMAAGASDSDVMAAFGWKSRQMLIRYGRANAEERALASKRRRKSIDDVLG